MSYNQPAQHPAPEGYQVHVPVGQRQAPGRSRRRRALLVILLVVVLVAAGLTTVVILATRDHFAGRSVTDSEPSSLPSASRNQQPEADVPTIPVDVPGWREGEPITEETLRAVPPEMLWWTVYKRHSMVPVQELILEPWVARAGRPLGSTELVTPQVRTIRTVFDYRSKVFARAEASRVNGELDGASICVDGKLYFKTATDLQQGRPYNLSAQPQTGARYCPLVLNDEAYQRYRTVATWLNDAHLTGGLSGGQADRFIDCLRERKLISVTRVAVVQAAGQRYVAVEGEVNRIEDRQISPDIKQGTGLVRDCFDLGTGLDADHHPYPFIVGGAQGLRWIYYLDSGTLRPAFSKVQTTPVLGVDGSASPRNAEYNESVSWGQWSYPPAVPRFTVADGENPLTVAWPQDLPGR